MGGGDEIPGNDGQNGMNGLTHYLKHERLYVLALLFIFLMVQTSINATSLLMEAVNEGDLTPGWIWFVLEYTSGISMFMLFPMVLLLVNRFPIDWSRFKRNIGWHVLGSMLFTLLHMMLMTLMRKLVFHLVAGSAYSMGDFGWQLLYEYRKDAWTYVAMVAGIYIYRFILGRLRGEASLVAEGEHSPPETVPDRLLVKKLGKEFIVRVDEIEWLESAGNYVNLHVGKRIYPLRSTLSQLIRLLEPKGFRRTHRSFAVNLDFVSSITPLESGDAQIVLVGGQQLSLSRRYRDEFRNQLGLN